MRDMLDTFNGATSAARDLMSTDLGCGTRTERSVQGVSDLVGLRRRHEFSEINSQSNNNDVITNSQYCNFVTCNNFY